MGLISPKKLRVSNLCQLKKTTLTDAERAKRIRQTAREAGTDNNPASFDRAFEKVVQPPKKQERLMWSRNSEGQLLQGCIVAAP
jgi:formylmethanofuran dehydrogenase subunit B